MDKYYLFYALALISEIIGTVSGFGSSILFVPLASMFFDFQAVLGITAIFHVFSNLSKIFLFQKGINKSIVIKLGIPAVVFVVIGALLTNVVPQKELELLMCVILLGLSFYLIVYSNKVLAQTNTNLVAGGILSGFLAGLIGTGGSIRGLTLAAFNLEKDVFIATSAMIDLGVDSSRAIVYYLNGFVKQEFLFTIPFLIIVSMLGSWIGKQVLTKIPQDIFKYLVLVVIIVSSIAQAIKYFYT